MKKYLYLITILLLGITLQVSLKSYAFKEDCNNIIDHPKGLNSLNLKEYIIEKHHEADINYFCSYNKCYKVKNQDINKSIKDYLTIQEQKGLEDYVIESYVKGFPITEISFNLCE